MGGEAFKRRLVHSVAFTIMAWNNFILDVFARVLKYKADLNIKFKFVCVITSMCLLVMSPFSCDFYNLIRLIEVFTVF